MNCKTGLRKSTTILTNNVSNAMRKVNERVDELNAHHENRIDRLERYSLEKDIIISGIPIDNKDDPFAIMGDICNALECHLKQGDFSAVFRLGNNKSKSKRTVPIVARLQDEWAQQELLGAYFRQMNLSLTDIGFKTAKRIFNERLTSSNRDIFNRASEAKVQSHSSFLHQTWTCIHTTEREWSSNVRFSHRWTEFFYLRTTTGNATTVTTVAATVQWISRTWTSRVVLWA